MRLIRDNCTLHPDGPGVFHISFPGSDALVVTIKNFKGNRPFRRWGTRPYGEPNTVWVWRNSAEEAIEVAVTQFAPRPAGGGCST